MKLQTQSIFLLKKQTTKIFFDQPDVSQKFNQGEINDLVRDLGLSKQQSMVLASRLKSKAVLSVGTKVNFYASREKELISFFFSENQVVYFNDVEGLLKAMGHEFYNPEDWR